MFIIYNCYRWVMCHKLNLLSPDKFSFNFKTIDSEPVAPKS